MFSVENRKSELIEMLIGAEDYFFIFINSIMLAFIFIIKINFTYNTHFTRPQGATNRGK